MDGFILDSYFSERHFFFCDGYIYIYIHLPNTIKEYTVIEIIHDNRMYIHVYIYIYVEYIYTYIHLYIYKWLVIIVSYN